jgi:hypothetical protein
VSEATLRPRTVAIGIVAVVIAHAGLVLALYRARVVTRSPVAESDFVLFALPLLLACSATAYLLLRSDFLRGVSSPSRIIVRVVAAVLTALLVACVSTILSLFVPFNLYGT